MKDDKMNAEDGMHGRTEKCIHDFRSMATSRELDVYGRIILKLIIKRNRDRIDVA
jgi:hypothetical protein